MGWTTFYQWKNGAWHFDDGRSSKLVTLCGLNYEVLDRDTEVPPKRMCKKCRQLMPRLLLQLGIPEIRGSYMYNQLTRRLGK